MFVLSLLWFLFFFIINIKITLVHVDEEKVQTDIQQVQEMETERDAPTRGHTATQFVDRVKHLYKFKHVCVCVSLLRPPDSSSEAVSVSGVPPGAHMFDYHLGAVFTVDSAAPVELAVAAADHLGASFLHSQAAFVAQSAAAPLLPLAQTLPVLQALPALGAVEAHADVPPTVVRRVLQVDQLGVRDAAERLREGSPTVGAVSRSHAPFVDVQLQGLLVFDLQIVPDLPEVCQLCPAGLDAAAL